MVSEEDDVFRAGRIGTLLLVIALLVTSVTAGLGAAAVGDTGATSSNAAAATESVAVSGVDAGSTGSISEESPRASNATANETTLTVLTYNDIQTAASNPEAMGRLVGAVNARKSAHNNPTVVIGGGDQVSPSSLSPVSNWSVPVETLNVLDPAAEVVGNHDLDYGFEPVKDFSEASKFPWLVANIEDNSGESIPGTKEYTIVERNGVKIGIVGLVDDAVKPKTAVDFEEAGYEVQDFVDVGSSVATELKTEQDVDVVVAAAHIGVPESKELANNTENIDLIVTGDDEVTFEPETIGGTAIVEAEARAAYLGEVNLTVSDEDVALDSGRLLTLDGSNEFPINQTANATVADARGKYLSQVAGQTTASLDSTFGSNYAEDTGWGNIITDAFLAQTGADVALTNAGGIRGNFVIEAGNVTYDDVYTSLPFGNYLVTKEMTGEQLKELLASQITRYDAEYGAQAQLQVSGVTYEFVDRTDADAKVQDLHVQGETVQSDETYAVTLNSYMAGWSFDDRYNWSVSDLPTVEKDYTLYGTAAVDYIEANSPVSPPDSDRIRRVTRTVGTPDVGAGSNLTMLTFELPSEVADVDGSSVHIENETTATVEPVGAFFSNGQLSATFNTSRLRPVAANSQTLELYAAYNDSEIDSQRASYDQSVLNGDLPIEAVEASQETATETETPTETPTEASTSTETQTEGTTATETQTEGQTATETSGDSGPGFGVVLAVVALISVAGLARRR